MRVLVSGHGADLDAVNKARRTVPYGKLVLVTTTPDARELATMREHETLAGVSVDVRPVDPADFEGALDEARNAIAAHAGDETRVHVAGGPNLVTSALLLAAFQTGADAFYCHPRGVSRLPVARRVDLAERFSATDRAVLVALQPDAASTLADVGRAARLSPATVKSALLRLRKHGLVDATHEQATLSATGAYYRAHFAADAREVTP